MSEGGPISFQKPGTRQLTQGSPGSPRLRDWVSRSSPESKSHDMAYEPRGLSRGKPTRACRIRCSKVRPPRLHPCWDMTSKQEAKVGEVVVSSRKPNLGSLGLYCACVPASKI